MAVAPAYSTIERANLLPIGNALGFFSSPESQDSDFSPTTDNRPESSRFAKQYQAESTANELGENNPRIPDFRGLSLRSSLALARTYQLALEVKGDGYVVSQEPRPGVPEKSNRLSNSEEPKEGVQILLAAPGQRTSGLQPSLDSYLGCATEPSVQAAAFSSAARPSQYGRGKLEVKALALRRIYRKRHCQNAPVVDVRCIAR
ncbi:MAG: hypothetical protein JO071_06910 [Deltaproteobacteria bacterium]|nr:hypothetical protein [Deltaproteobacteria bacterium]